jgi:uncharacterized protein YukE
MSDQNSVDPNSLNDAANQFDDQANNLSEAIGSLDANMSTLGSCWGDDHPGSVFGSGYQQHSQAMVQGAQSLVKGLEDISTRLQETARAIDNLNKPTVC